jgi:isopentenyl phosphate kinase
MESLVFIKLGGSVITDKSKPFCARKRVVRRLAGEIKEALRAYKGKIIIVHGGGSFPHVPAKKYQTQLGMVNNKSLKGLSLTSDAAIAINRIVVGEFLKENLPVVSFAGGSAIYAKGGKLISSYTVPIKKALEIGVIPLLYGDVVFDELKGFCIFSGEKIISFLISTLNKEYLIKKVIFCSDTDGVYDTSGKTIKKITPKSFNQVLASLGGSGKVDVTGGMLHKVGEALNMAKKFKTDILIVNGLKKNTLKRAIWGKKVEGTEITS